MLLLHTELCLTQRSGVMVPSFPVDKLLVHFNKIKTEVGESE